MSRFFEIKYNTTIEYYSLIINNPSYNFLTAFSRLHYESLSECNENLMFSVATHGTILLETMKHIEDRNKIKEYLFEYFEEFKNECKLICSMKVLNEIEIDWINKELNCLSEKFI